MFNWLQEQSKLSALTWSRHKNFARSWEMLVCVTPNNNNVHRLAAFKEKEFKRNESSFSEVSQNEHDANGHAARCWKGDSARQAWAQQAH